MLNERIEKQMADGKLEVDMAFFQTVQDFVTWKKQGRLLAFMPEGFDQIMPNLRDENGTYMALSANALTIVVAGDLSKIEQPIRALNLGTVEVWDPLGNKVR